jgi:hypothetical protein
VRKRASGGRRFWGKREAEILQGENIHNDAVFCLRTPPMKLLDLQYVVKIKAEGIYNLGTDKERIPAPPFTERGVGD